jgi:hypothetical protein
MIWAEETQLRAADHKPGDVLLADGGKDPRCTG